MLDFWDEISYNNPKGAIMTCGIYLLKFFGTTKVYVGQSKNIEKRYTQHLSSLSTGTANYKLLEAFKQYGKPSYEVILETSILELDDAEDEAIEIWNSVETGLNIHSTANQAPTHTGYGGGNSKYPKHLIIEVFKYLVDTNKSFSDISGLTDIPVATISTIASARSHVWLKDEFPDEYAILISKLKTRRQLISSTIVSDKLSAKSKGIQYPKIKDPQGNIYIVENAYRFAKQHGLAPNHFQEVLNGHRNSHKGWKVCLEELQ